MTTVALGIPHKPDGGERDRSLEELLTQLGMQELARSWMLSLPSTKAPNLDVVCRVFDTVEPNREWARRMWRWGLDTGADFFLTLQDDTRVMPGFWGVLGAMLTALPPRVVLALSAQHDGIALRMAPWAASHYFPVVGWAYGMGRPELESLVAYDQSGAEPGLTEDSFVNAWCGARGVARWHPVPTPVQHRVELRSTYGNYPRAAPCSWEAMPRERWGELATPAYWRGPVHDIPRPVHAAGPNWGGSLPPAPNVEAYRHPNVMGSQNYGGSPPPPYVPAKHRGRR